MPQSSSLWKILQQICRKALLELKEGSCMNLAWCLKELALILIVNFSQSIPRSFHLSSPSPFVYLMLRPILSLKLTTSFHQHFNRHLAKHPQIISSKLKVFQYS